MAASLVSRTVCRSFRPSTLLSKCMKSPKSLSVHSVLTVRCNSNNSSSGISDTENAGSSNTKSHVEGALDKFAKVVDKVNKTQLEPSAETSAEVLEDPNESFASMLRRSKFVSLGEHKDRLVQGEIIEVMEDDLYIDFGGKFHCVCPRPKRNGERYHRGSKVLLSLQAMEMSSSFLGSDIHVTLLEADATLLGLAGNQKQQGQRNRPQTRQQ